MISAATNARPSSAASSAACRFAKPIELGKYVERLRKHSDEVHRLADDLLITVTNFFRDPEVYELLEKDVIPRLFEGKAGHEAIRVWSVGCATGEEAYSLAILSVGGSRPPQERPGRSRSLPATSTNARSKRPAKASTPATSRRTCRPKDWNASSRKRTAATRSARKSANSSCSPRTTCWPTRPFRRLDLIACRNLLIYLQREVQRDVIELFHYALKPEGFLVLGTSETLEAADLFRVEDKKCCLYRKRNVPAPEPRLPVFPWPRRGCRAKLRLRTDQTERTRGSSARCTIGWSSNSPRRASW